MPPRPPRSRRLPSVRSVRLFGRLMPGRPRAACEPYPEWSGTQLPQRIIALGDLQRTILAERVYLARRQNDNVREALLAAVSDEHPDVLLLLGDQVADGASEREWAYFDELMRVLRNGHTGVHAIRGNHDYSSFDRDGSVRNFNARFPRQRGALPELARFGPLAYIGVDTNIATIGAERAQRQADAYRRLLQLLDRDETVSGIIVAAHHPPYSNSALPKNPAVIEMFAEPFLEARKSLLMLSAHVHAYERFEIDGRQFVVSGGGGGPRRRVDITGRRRWHTDAYKGPALRPFHYVRLTPGPDSLLLETIMLEEPSTSWLRAEEVTAVFHVGDRVEMKYGREKIED